MKFENKNCNFFNIRDFNFNNSSFSVNYSSLQETVMKDNTESLCQMLIIYDEI